MPTLVETQPQSIKNVHEDQFQSTTQHSVHLQGRSSLINTIYHARPSKLIVPKRVIKKETKFIKAPTACVPSVPKRWCTVSTATGVFENPGTSINKRE